MDESTWITIISFAVGLIAQGIIVSWKFSRMFGGLEVSMGKLETRIESITERCQERGEQHKEHYINADHVNKTLENHSVRLNQVEGRVDKLENQ
jgi:hypothetical protein